MSTKIDRLFKLPDTELFAEVKESFPFVEGGNRDEWLKYLLKEGLDKIFTTKW